MTIWFLGSPSFVIIRVYSWLKNCGWMSPRLFGLTLLAALPLRAQDTLQPLLDADQLRITARLDPTAPVIATQRAKLIIEIATPNWFTGGTRLGDLQVRNAIVLQRQTFGNNSNRRINGQTWAVQGWEFEIFPRYPGSYEIPGVDVSVEVASGSGASIRGEMATEPLTLEAIAPPVEPPAETWVVSPDLNIRTTWDLPREVLMAGDARQRTITITAEELPSMVLPAPTYADIDGIGTYPQPARRDDQTNRGQSTATLTQTVSYFCEDAGEFVIPGFQLAWWNPVSATWQIAEVPTETLVVAANPDAANEAAESRAAPTPAKTFLKRFLLITTALFGLALMIRALRRGFARLLAARRQRPETPARRERAHWHDVQRALRGGDANAIVSALYRWRDSLPLHTAEPTLQAMTGAADEPGIEPLINVLLASRYSDKPGDFRQIEALETALQKARRQILKKKNREYTLGFDFSVKKLN